MNPFQAEKNRLAAKITIQNLHLALPNGASILHGISLEVLAGKVTSLIGPSGSGKSSLLRCLNRLWEPPPGSVFLDGEDITVLDVLQLRRRVGILFQGAALFEGTVLDNVTYGPRLRGHLLSDHRVGELLNMAGLDAEFVHRPVHQLSGGQAQRVALARTLANEPEILLLDEPTSALDPAAVQRIERTVLQLRDRLGLTVVWVSHDLEQLERTADWVVLMVDGEVAESASAEHLLTSDHRHLFDEFAAGRL
jgi:ABC-type phosphate transport system ATPase subunit